VIKLDTAPLVAEQVNKINLVSPEGILIVAYFPSLAINCKCSSRTFTQLLVLVQLIQEITVPNGTYLKASITNLS
jgi:hypothetical protein